MTSKKKKQKSEQDKPQETPVSETEPKSVEEQRDDLLQRLQRVSADYMNYQKRAQRDIAQAREFANESLIKSLLPVLDDMERALAAARDNHGEDDPLFQGMQMVHDKALDALGRFGLKSIEAKGKEFDPEQHTAIMQQPTDEHPSNVILHEAQKGYQLKGRTIRPTGVVVSKTPEEPKEDENDE